MRREKIMQTLFFGIVMVIVVTMALIFHGKESDPSTTTSTQTETKTKNVTKTTEETTEKTTEKTTEEMTEAPHDTSDWENQETGEPSTTETPGVQ